MLLNLPDSLKGLFHIINNILVVDFVKDAENRVHLKFEVYVFSAGILLTAHLGGPHLGVVEEEFALEGLLEFLQNTVTGLVVVAVTILQCHSLLVGEAFVVGAGSLSAVGGQSLSVSLSETLGVAESDCDWLRHFTII